MANDPLRLQYLLTQYAANTCTREELLEFLTLIRDNKENSQLYDSLDEVWHTVSNTDQLPNLDREKIYNDIMADKPIPQLRPVRKWIGYAAAAVIIFTISLGLYKLYQTPAPNPDNLHVKNKVIPPGSNQAVLTLSNGSRIALNGKQPGIVASQNHIPIKQMSNGEIAYQPNTADKSSGQIFNTLTTPIGGQYAITLTDGTRVWLNAMSSLKYPVTFTGAKRQVELSGEGYFEVAKNKNMPFTVTINNSEVMVYGTHFNIMGYTGEDNTNITLLEGSVKVTNNDHSKMLLPRQQAIIKNNIVAISTTDGEQAIAWKNGQFNFAHEHIDVIMRKLSRWFDIDVVYQGKITQEGFVGTLPRSKNLQEILQTLELTGSVHFKVDGRRVIVMQ